MFTSFQKKQLRKNAKQCNTRRHNFTVFPFLYFMKITFPLKNFQLYFKQKLPTLAMNIGIRGRMTATSILNFYSKSVFKPDIPSYITAILKI